jgi:hypothetical protein
MIRYHGQPYEDSDDYANDVIAAENRAKEDRKSKLTEVARDSMDHALYVEDNGAGGHRYWSDEIGGGVVVWDTSLVSPEMIRLALAHEEKTT